jgi:site-specific DNA-cytosine methylase
MNALSLFSGIGGLDLAAEAAGIKTAAMCERDPFCRAVLRKHWPDVPIFEDVKTLRGEDIAASIDIIHGGPPCQPVSVAGRRRGQSDERYLWREVFRIVAGVMPHYVVLENVSGILSIAADDICKELERIGYNVGICCFEAAAVGALHRRMRVFFVAHAGCGMYEGRAVEEAFRREHEGGAAADAERPSSAPLADAESRRCRNRLDGKDIGASSGENDTLGGAGASVPDAASRGRREGDEIAGRRIEGDEPGKRDRPAVSRPIFPDADDTRQLQQEGSVSRIGRRSGNCCEDISNSDSQRFQEQQSPFAAERKRAALGQPECDSGRMSEPGLGRMVDGLPGWMDGYWRSEPDIPRTARGIKDRVNRLRALGNAVVPAQAYPIFRAIAEAG